MRLDLPGSPHLTYCTNIHPGESWQEIDSNLRRHLPSLRNQVAGGRPVGVGLRLSADAAETLRHPAALDEFRHFLSHNDLYVFTANAFPYGPFHGHPVKERVYMPDWTTPERLRYTEQIAGILSALLPGGMEGSISTVPGAFREDGNRREKLRFCAEGMLEVAAHLAKLERETGKRIVLAPEPEPFCLLERTTDFIAFFNDFLLAPAAREKFARRTGTDSNESEELLRRHLGICFDVCHAAVLFESPFDSLRALKKEGIQIAKIQLSAALHLEGAVGGEFCLRRLDDGVYLHQVFHRHEGIVKGYRDLPEALTAMGEDGRGEWRVHCHVPLFAEGVGVLASTRSLTAEILDLCRLERVSGHLEVETYTWSVLPPEFRGGEIGADISRELQWVLSSLGKVPEEDTATRLRPESIR